MKEKLLQWLICPECNNELNLEISLQNEKEIIEGILRCSCRQKFPIIKGIPRLLTFPLDEKLLELYPDFFNNHPEFLNNSILQTKNKENKQKADTMDRFGYEWTHFSDYDCDNFTRFINPLPTDFLKGKLGLDVGCGMGRHALQASKEGAEVVAVDLSQAVDTAFHNNINNEYVHVVQADIYNLPFKLEIFQFIYSLGVLHHLPNPELGYQTLIPFLRKGGVLFIWLYAYAPRKIVLEILRSAAKRLSNDNIRRMAYLCNLVDYGIFINLYRLLKNLPLIGKWTKQSSPLRIKEYAEYGFRIAYADWFDRLSAPISNYYKETEMRDWLKRSDLCNTKVELVGDSWWWLYGERKT